MTKRFRAALPVLLIACLVLPLAIGGRRVARRPKQVASSGQTAADAAPNALLARMRAGPAIVDARNRAVASLHAGCTAGQVDDANWQQMSASDYSAWAARTRSPLWIIDDEAVLDAAGVAGINARTPPRAAQVRAASPGTLVGLYGVLGGEYWPYVNADDANWRTAREAIVARDDAMLPALAACDVLVGGAYPYYSEDPKSEHNDTRGFADPAAERRRRDHAYIAGTVVELRRLSAKLGGKPIAVMIWSVDHETLKPLSAARADAYIDEIRAQGVTLILWGDKTPDGGIGDRMLARASRTIGVR